MALGRKTGGGKRGPSKAKQAFRDGLTRYMTRKKVDPHRYMVDLLADDSTKHVVAGNGEVVEVPTIAPELKLQAAKELAQYLQPKLRAVEVSGDADNPLTLLHAMPDADLDQHIQSLLAQVGVQPPQERQP